MIIWKGYGFLVLIFALAIRALFVVAFTIFGSIENIGTAFGAIISGVIIWFVGNKFNAPEKARTFLDE
jgi:hypothetical protein